MEYLKALFKLLVQNLNYIHIAQRLVHFANTDLETINT